MAATAMCTVQLGSALTVPLFGQLGALGTAGLRLGWAGLILLVAIRPRPRDFSSRDLLACVVLGLVTAGMMVFFMQAIARLPLGTASALEFLGPLTVSLFGPRKGRLIWAAAAATGVVLLTEPWHGGADPVGVGSALLAAGCWAAYILLTQRVGDRVTGLKGLAVSMPIAAVVGLGIAAPDLAERVTWSPLWTMLALAVLSPVIPFALEFLALRHLTTSAFGTLMSLEPAIALIVGLLVLGQRPGVVATVGLVLVVVASVGATRAGVRPVASSTQVPVRRYEPGPESVRDEQRRSSRCQNVPS
ncbi:EamA family transporter [Streptomyces sp. Inha503]|uniref:EamA family transporter n=1 Tax=Streptomyces sp. Inha503 TaxID=3383314 RepID=UPI0039A3902C